jgi:hypothetical protein
MAFRLEHVADELCGALTDIQGAASGAGRRPAGDDLDGARAENVARVRSVAGLTARRVLEHEFQLGEGVRPRRHF